MTDKMHKLDIGKEKERLEAKLRDKGPEALTKAEHQILHSNRETRRRNGFVRQNVHRHQS